jgi:hypothetical protein
MPTDPLTALRAEVAAQQTIIERLHREVEATERLRAVVGFARDVRCWGIELDDPRLDYLTVQVDRVAVADLDAALVALDEGTKK